MMVLVIYRRLSGGFFAREFPAIGLTESRILQHLKDDMGTAPALRRADVVAIRCADGWHWPPLPETSMRVLYALKRSLELCHAQ